MRVGARWLAAGTDAELRPVATSRDARKAAVSPAPLAVINCHFDVADFLLAHGANVSTNWNSHEPASILHISSSCGTRMSGCNSCSIVGQPDGKRITARGARHPPTVQKLCPTPARTGPPGNFGGQQREVCETLLVDHEKVTEATCEDDHDGLMPYVLAPSRRAVVVVQHASQSLASLDRSITVCRNSLGSNEPVAQPLMISFQMVMGQELSDRFPQ